MTRLLKNTFLFFCIGGVLLGAACNRNDFTSDPACLLAFSADTLRFDTVFTALGSATRRLMVYNPNKQAVRTNITLAGKSTSLFRINIDGMNTDEARNMEIAAEDSLYIFVEVTVEPQNSDVPVIVSDSILFETSTGRQRVCLEACGQDVFILRDAAIQSETWSGTKPYLIYGRLTVDTLETLRIKPGVRIYLHKGADVYIKGSMIAEGETGSPIIFSGDRLEKMYRDIPGQWGSIIFTTASRNNLLRHVEIRNGTNGLIFGNTQYAQTPALALDAVTITNMSNSGLMVSRSSMDASNCLITNCASYTVGLFGGGDYFFNHCTIANCYSPYIRRKPVPALAASNSNAGQEGQIACNVFLGNTIIYGTLKEEIRMEEMPSFSFDHCLLRTGMNTSTTAFTGVLTNADPMFADPYNGNFSLREHSPARDAGCMPLAVLQPEDMDGNNRINGGNPDMGAYEYVREK